MGKRRAQEKEYAEPLAVLCTEKENLAEGKRLAQELRISLYTSPEEGENAALVLRWDKGCLSLSGEGQTLRGDFTRLLPRIRKENLGSELLIRAAKRRGTDTPTVLDATAGLGEDSFLLAAAGFYVHMYEYDPVICALLQDALFRAKKDPALSGIAGRMRLTRGDSIQAMQALAEPPDVILLDPMFPKRRKSASVKKKFRLLHQLECPCETEQAMLSAALSAGPCRIVIKRPAKGAWFAGMKPTYSITGKSVRYDCIVPPGREEAK